MTFQGPNVTWQFIVTVHFTVNMMPPTFTDADSNTVSVSVKNTVVTSGADVLLHQPNGTHQISWSIDHKALTGIQFTVTITISNTVGGGTVRTFQETQAGIGQGNWTWDGKNTMGQDAGAGVYAYNVYATDVGMCNDQDKSTALTTTVNDSKFYYVAKNVQAGTLTVMVRYTLSQDASDCTIRFYGPDFTQLGELDNQAATGTVAHWSDQAVLQGALDQNGNPVTPMYCVIWATENDNRAKQNHGQDHKQALQKGATTLELMQFGLKSVTYGGSGFTAVARDYGGTYGGPQ
jgi:flagellar hook assembly protein FlgD